MDMKIRRLNILLLLLTAVITARAQTSLDRSSPEEQGMLSENVMAFLDGVMLQKGGGECHSAMVLRHGKVVGEAYPKPFRPEYSQTIYSCSKTFTAVAVGLAYDRNLIRPDDRVGALLPEYLPANVTDLLADITVKDLLTMSSGIVPDWSLRNRSHTWISNWLAKPVSAMPGEKFAYDSMSSYLLSAIVQKVTGKTVLENLRELVFGPMSITQAEWEVSPEGFNTGGWGIRVQPETMAKFGQLLLQKGRWGDEQLVSEEWINNMMTPRMHVNAKENYGFQMWQCEYPGAWRADGAFGQFIVVIPEQDIVVVLTQCTQLGGKILQNVWQHLLTDLKSEPYEPSESYSRLLRKQQQYEMQPAAGSRAHKGGGVLQGKTVGLQSNDMGWRTISFRFEADSLNLRITNDAGETFTVKCGNGKWLTGNTEVCPPYTIKAVDRFKGITRDFAVSGSYGWLPDGTLTFHVVYPSWISGINMSYNPKTNIMTVKENTKAKAYQLRVTPVK